MLFTAFTMTVAVITFFGRAMIMGIVGSWFFGVIVTMLILFAGSMLFLAFFTFMAWLLKKEYWKDVH